MQVSHEGELTLIFIFKQQHLETVEFNVFLKSNHYVYCSKKPTIGLFLHGPRFIYTGFPISKASLLQRNYIETMLERL